MKRLYSNGTLSFWTTYQNKDICLYQIEIKEPFEYETEQIDEQLIDIIIKNDKDDTALYFISNDTHLIALQSVVADNQEVTYPVIIFDEKKYKPAIQEDNLIFITTSSNLLIDYPLVKEYTKEIEHQFVNRLNICEIHTHPDSKKIQYYGSHPSYIDASLSCFHFDINFEEIYANYREDKCRVSKWTYNVGQKNEYVITQCDDTGESVVRYTHLSEQLKYSLTRPKTLAILGGLAMIATGVIKYCHQNDEKEIPHPNSVLIQSAETPKINSSHAKTR